MLGRIYFSLTNILAKCFFIMKNFKKKKILLKQMVYSLVWVLDRSIQFQNISQWIRNPIPGEQNKIGSWTGS